MDNTKNMLPVFVRDAAAQGKVGEFRRNSLPAPAAMASASSSGRNDVIVPRTRTTTPTGLPTSQSVAITPSIRSLIRAIPVGPRISVSVSTEAYIAAHRFGYGPYADPSRADSLAAIQSRGARRWLLDQIGDNGRRAIAASRYGFGEMVNGQKTLFNTGDAARESFVRAGNVQFVEGVMGADGNFGDYDAYMLELSRRHQGLVWLRQAVKTEFPFAHSLVSFFVNHLCVRFSCEMANRALFGGMMTAYYNALMPVVLSDNAKYEDLLITALQHPAMQFQYSMNYSRNIDFSNGPGRPIAAIEDAPREILRLMTVEEGYTQEHVATLAKMLAGWTNYNSPDVNTAGKFFFASSAHVTSTTVWSVGPYDLRPLVDWRTDAYPPELNFANEAAIPAMYANYPRGRSFNTPPGMITVWIGAGKTMEALRALARHPNTARNVCNKLVQHYISDDVTAGVGREIAEAMRQEYLRTNGQLSAVFRVMINHPRALGAGGGFSKFKDPLTYYLSVMRGANLIADKPYELPIMTRWSGTLTPNVPGNGRLVDDISMIPLPTSHGDDLLTDLLLRILPIAGHALFNPPSVQGYLPQNSRWQTAQAAESRYHEVAQNYLSVTATNMSAADLLNQTIAPALRAGSRSGSRILLNPSTETSAIARIAGTLLSPEMQMRGAVI